MSDPSRNDQAVDEAIGRVLAAEDEARDAVDACRREARMLVAEARAGTRRILQRADRRISALHSHCLLSVGRSVRSLQAETASIPLAPSGETVQDERLDEVVRRLAADLTGGGE